MKLFSDSLRRLFHDIHELPAPLPAHAVVCRNEVLDDFICLKSRSSPAGRRKPARLAQGAERADRPGAGISPDDLMIGSSRARVRIFLPVRELAQRAFVPQREFQLANLSQHKGLTMCAANTTNQNLQWDVAYDKRPWPYSRFAAAEELMWVANSSTTHLR